MLVAVSFGAAVSVAKKLTANGAFKWKILGDTDFRFGIIALKHYAETKIRLFPAVRSSIFPLNFPKILRTSHESRTDLGVNRTSVKVNPFVLRYLQRIQPDPGGSGRRRAFVTF